ncbi:MerR family transcriptional regulator [Streptomyces sp. Caat 7-52]|uniref:MerR family transcriptional regulator n=1 Tax=Streptomyces sp. Caat 7-52 TaxID=2949637 RepID=UPI002034E676|nr:MerR family transcriptional regulator [Streptomyces sp. Caat 7-52]
MQPDGLWSIGELAERAGVTVKTVRYYSDRGLLPEAGRSGGGHRRYGPGALDRIRVIRSLRALDLAVPEVERVLDQDEALEDVLAGRLRKVEGELAALRWREASLRLLAESAAEERAERLRLLGAVALPPDRGAVVRFWRRVLPVRLPAGLASRVLDAVVPPLPPDPAPEQVLAFARLHALVSDPQLDRVPGLRPGPPLAGESYRPAVLYEGLEETYGLAGAEARGGRPPEGGGALDCFVAAYAAALGAGDGPAFRRRLVELLARDDGPVMGRYWKLAAPLLPADEPALGLLHYRLVRALRADSAPTA